MQDFLKFKKMITPVIIQILFWIGVAMAIIMGLIMILAGAGTGQIRVAFLGLLFLFFGPILVRIYCELLIVFFSINDTLTEIKNQLKLTH